MTIPGTIARPHQPASSRRENAATTTEPATESPSARQSAAEPVAADGRISRRDYFRSLVPSFGAALVRGLRGFENFKRDLQEKIE